MPGSETGLSGAVVPQPSAPNLQPPSIPDHELIRRIGGGSYGEVWLAHNVLGDHRAVRVIYRDRFEHDRPFDREFEGIQKFEPISRLHESQVDILHVGRNDTAGYFYYVMELADDAGENPNDKFRNPKQARNPNNESDDAAHVRTSGFGIRSGFDIRNSDLYVPHTLKLDLYRHGRLPVEDCIRVGLALTTALEHLHAHGLVHRDIKPSNIIFVGGVPKLADIGLVASMDATMSFVGTSGFLPPEGPGASQADIYSLGKVLYEMSMGRDRLDFPKLPPDLLAAASRESAADRVLPEAGSGLKSAALSRDTATTLLELNAVILKACHSDPRQRRQQRWALCKKASLAAVLVVLAAIIALRFTRRGADDFVESSISEVDVLVDQGEHCLWGRAPDRVQTALVCYKKAIDLDPKFVPAWWGLHSVYVYQGGMNHDAPADVRRELRAVATKLMEIDPRCAESAVTSAELKWIDWQFREALAEGHLATQLRARCKSGRTWAHGAYGFYLQGTGNPSAAFEQYKLAEKFSPSDPIIQDHLGQAYFEKRDFKQARKYYQKSLDMEPRQGGAHYFMAKVGDWRCD